MLLEKHIAFIDSDAIVALLIIAVCAAGMLGCLGWMVWHRFRMRYHAQRMESNPSEMAPTELLHGQIVEKHSDIRYGRSYRYPTHYVDFSIVFLTDENQRLTLSVPEERFPLIQELATGTLAISADQFIDFVPDPTEPSADDPHHLTLV